MSKSHMIAFISLLSSCALQLALCDVSSAGALLPADVQTKSLAQNWAQLKSLRSKDQIIDRVVGEFSSIVESPDSCSPQNIEQLHSKVDNSISVKAFGDANNNLAFVVRQVALKLESDCEQKFISIVLPTFQNPQPVVGTINKLLKAHAVDPKQKHNPTWTEQALEYLTMESGRGVQQLTQMSDAQLEELYVKHIVEPCESFAKLATPAFEALKLEQRLVEQVPIQMLQFDINQLLLVYEDMAAVCVRSSSCVQTSVKNLRDTLISATGGKQAPVYVRTIRRNRAVELVPELARGHLRATCEAY